MRRAAEAQPSWPRPAARRPTSKPLLTQQEAALLAGLVHENAGVGPIQGAFVACAGAGSDAGGARGGGRAGAPLNCPRKSPHARQRAHAAHWPSNACLNHAPSPSPSLWRTKEDEQRLPAAGRAVAPVLVAHIVALAPRALVVAAEVVQPLREVGGSAVVGVVGRGRHAAREVLHALLLPPVTQRRRRRRGGRGQRQAEGQQGAHPGGWVSLGLLPETGGAGLCERVGDGGRTGVRHGVRARQERHRAPAPPGLPQPRRSPAAGRAPPERLGAGQRRSAAHQAGKRRLGLPRWSLLRGG